jgi:hypothetical protein
MIKHLHHSYQPRNLPRSFSDQSLQAMTATLKLKWKTTAQKFVKCARPHLTSECDKAQLAQSRCYHCGKNRPENYRGCGLIRELQKLIDDKNKSKQQTNANILVRVVPNNEPKTQKTSWKLTVR